MEQSSNQRLMISKMVLENFKSYAGVKEIGPFHKRFSSIVGPNGSGKSNVIDALLFVFGKRAKQLRLNKVSELIHKSSSFPDLEYARVSVHFQIINDIEESDDDFNTVEGSEFIITRTAFKNNQSKYTINDKNSTFTEVGTLLRQFGVDLDNNRFLILQGEVEQIAMMKPKGATPHEEGLLEYLEDIIGSNRFVEKIDESSKKLDEINDQRVEKVNRLKLAEKERDNLSGSKLEAENFLESEKQIRRKKNALYQLLSFISEKNSKDFSDRKEKILEKLNYEKSKLGDNEQRLKSMESSYEEIKKKHDKVAAQLHESSTQYDAFERRDVKLQEDMKHCRANIKKQNTILNKEASKEKDSAVEAESLKVQIGKYENLLADFENKKVAEETAADEIMLSLQDSTEELRQNLEKAQLQLSEAEKSVACFQTEKDAIETNVQITLSRSQNAEKLLQANKDKLENVTKELKVKSDQLKELQTTRVQDMRKKISEGENLITQCEKEEKNLQEALKEAVTETEMTKAKMSRSKSSSRSVVEKIIKAAQKGGPLARAGVVGRLGDLGTIHPDYDVAISTCCGFLDYIVVETADGGQACVNYLRKNNLGRASFIILDQLKDWEAKMSRAVNIPTGISRLYDLVTPSHPNLNVAFYMALRDTLVAQNLDVAVKIAYDGEKPVWRVVTLDGNLIDTSGAMSGGGKEVRSGSMRLSSASSKASHKSAFEIDDVSPETLKTLESKVEDLKRKLSECRVLKEKTEQEVRSLKKAEQGISTEVQKLEIAISRLHDQKKEISQKIKSLADETKPTQDELKSIDEFEAQLKQIEDQMISASPNLRKFQAEVASLQRQILNVGGPRLANIQSKIDSYVAQIEMLTNNVSTKQAELDNLMKQSTKSSAARKKAEEEISKAEEKLNSLVQEQKEMENDAMAVISALEEHKSKLTAYEEQLNASMKEYNELKSSISTIKNVEVDLTVELERVSGELKESETISQKWRKEVKAIQEQHIAEQKEFLSTIASVKASTDSLFPNQSNTDANAMEVDEDSSKKDEDIEHLPEYSPEDLNEFDPEELKKEINILESEKNKLKSNVNMNALLEYLKKDANYKSKLFELEQITEIRNVIRKEYEDLRRKRLEEFMNGFGIISLKLKEMYQMITLGGDAELELLDSLDPFSEGIVFSVRPPKKSWKNISNLSGGEKTLSSLALVFALHHYKPTPLYVMDEIDAALDFKNVSIVANYIKDRTKNAQFVIISLRNNMFELADRLVGIYKTNDVTKSVTINPKLFEGSTKAPASESKGQISKSRPLEDSTNKI